jgi:hypothetical protein
VNARLAVIEDTVDASAAADTLQPLLPAAARHRQLTARTLLIGMHLALAGSRPAHLTRAHQALTSLPEHDQKRLGVIEDWAGGPHQLTYRQAEHTHRLITRALSKQHPDGAPSPRLQHVCEQLAEASIPARFKNASTSLAVDWTDVEAWSRPVPAGRPGTGTDPEARWGHRNVNRKIQEGEMFYGYYLPAATMVKDENGPAVPELVRRITVCSSACDPAAALAAVLADMAAAGIHPGDILAGSGFSYRQESTWAIPLLSAGAALVQDLHPNDRGPHGTHHGAIIANGCLYCPATPSALLQLIPLPPGAGAAGITAHDQQTAELARHKLGLHAAADADGYRRLACPAATGKIRCPLRPESMKLTRDRPEILTPPQHPQACCTQQTITVPPTVAAKTRQKHDYPSQAWRLSYQRRTAAERLNATIKDTATSSIGRGWIRLTGITPLMFWLTCLMAVRNQRILTAWDKRQQDHTRRASGQPLRSRRHRKPATPAPP